jgi:hypothetical protein
MNSMSEYCDSDEAARWGLLRSTGGTNSASHAWLIQSRDSYLPHYVNSNGRNQTVTKYGMTGADYETLLNEQGGKCAICDATYSKTRALAVDHDHDTGQVRGLLCGRCNSALGMLGDDPETAAKATAYLRERKRVGLADHPEWRGEIIDKGKQVQPYHA